MIRTNLALVTVILAACPVAAQNRAGPLESGPRGHLDEGVAEGNAPEQGVSLNWWSIDGGGGSTSGGGFSLVAAAGQPESGFSSNGGTVIASGLWSGAIDLQFIFGDGFEVGDLSMWGGSTATDAQHPRSP